MSVKLRRRYLVFDYETRSRANIKLVGGYEYSLHGSTQMLCVAWRYGTKAEILAQLKAGVPAQVWSPAIPSSYGEFIRALCDPLVILVAHNAQFEQNITRHVLSKIIHRPELKTIPISRWLCTASLARALALPGKLEGACEALKLPIQKDMDGHRLMLKMSKPRKPSKRNPAVWHQSLDDLKRLMAYCQTDVDAESWLLLKLKPLIPFERKLWELDQKINLRGFHVDRPLVTTILRMIGEETSLLDQETVALTGGALTTTRKVAAVIKWLKEQDVFFPDFKAQTVKDALREGIVEGRAKRILEIRQGVSKTSTKKYEAFDFRSRSDGRLRDILIYHGAGPGRFTGAGVQPQNLSKSVLSAAQLEIARDILRGVNA